MSGSRDIDWSQMEKKRFFTIGTALFLCVRSIVYPSSLIKTRIQVTKKGEVYRSTLGAFRQVVVREGVRGLYKGFSIAAVGIVPAQAIYVSSYELSRSQVKTFIPVSENISPATREFYCNALGGGMASLSSQLIVVPVDIISQRLMLQSRDLQTSNPVTTKIYKNGYDVFRTITQTEGIKGLYRGFLPSILTYLPSSAAWWGTYGFAKEKYGQLFKHQLHPNIDYPFSTSLHSPVDLLTQIMSASTSALVSVTLTQPMDVVKTRLQTQQVKNSSNVSLIKIFVNLVKEEGVSALSKGWTARLLSSVPVSSLMVLVYELTKKLSLKEEFKVNRKSEYHTP